MFPWGFGKSGSESAGGLMLKVDGGNRIIGRSGNVRGFLGTDFRDLKGQSVLQIVDPTDRDRFASGLNYLRRTPISNEGQVSLLTRLGNVGGREGGKVLARFVRAAKNRITILLIDIADDFPAGADQTDGAGSRHSGLSHELASDLADLTHDMKTPLNAILGFADAMREQTFGPLGDTRYEGYVRDIHRAGSHLLDLVTTTLDEIRDGETTECPPEPTHLADLIDDCVTMVRQPLEQNRLRLTAAIDPSAATVSLDRTRLRQILINLLANAVKFTSDGIISVSAHARGGATGTASVNELVVTVSDTGVGMAAEDLAKLGPRFTEQHRRGVRGAGGHGLGLSLACRLAHEMGGRIDLKSAPGEGLRATVYLPQTASPDRVGTDERILHAVPSDEESKSASVTGDAARILTHKANAA